MARRLPQLVLIARRLPRPVLIALAMVALAGCSLLSGDTPTMRPTAPAAASTPVAQAVPAGWRGGSVDIGELPAEAIDTLRLIAQGGPFLYDQDGSTFQNREGLLPAHPRGYYREYTVETPGSPDRGARRIVTGDRGERYYTDDHYDSFRWVAGELDG